MADLDPTLAHLALTDHHCHGVVRRDLDADGLADLLTEGDGPGVGRLDSAIGFALRRWCPPVLDLPAHAPAEDYLARRGELGHAEVSRRMLGATGTSTFLVDTGLEPEPLTSPTELAGLVGGTGREVVRLETVAEEVLAGGCTAGGFAEAVRTRLAQRCADAVAVKSVAAYRVGLALSGERPSPAEVAVAAGHLLDAGGAPRVADEVLHRFLLWCGVDLGLPVQLHTGLGDADVDLHRCDPTLLTPWLRATAGAGVPVMLLHGYPFHRHAGYLAQVFDHVHVDVGLATHHVGARAREVLAELTELAPWSKVLFSSDAYGLPELYLLGTVLFRRALGGLLADGVAGGEWTGADAVRVVGMVGTGNAARVYGL
ncbi:amidohydrolase family protein [Rhodococcus aerolatus]